MLIDKFDKTIVVASGTGSIVWSDDVSQWIVNAIAIKPPSPTATYTLLVSDEAGNALAYETNMVGNVTTEMSVETNSAITIAIQGADTDGDYAVRIYTKK